MRKEFGDFQTPPALVERILDYLARSGKKWDRVLEPTCGDGNFIRGMLEHDGLPVPGEIYGIEIQEARLTNAYRQIAVLSDASRVELRLGNVFELDLGKVIDWHHAGDLLVIGNPPWVTNSELGAISSQNLPQKWNLKRLPGLEAMTGGSNFDIAEYILLKLIWELHSQRPTIAMLCKTSVARNVLLYAFQTKLPLEEASIRKIPAKKWFDADVDACLLHVEIGQQMNLSNVFVYADLEADKPDSCINLSSGQLIANQASYAKVGFIEGRSHLEWRQGIKHDAASVMELKYDHDSGLWNKSGEFVDVEDAYIYPLLKSSDLYNGRIKNRAKAVIVTQKSIGEDTTSLASRAPKLWQYLSEHQRVFAERKSSIYKGRPPFSMFGIGDYSFSLHKVAISGFYKTPQFVALHPQDGKPIMLDDTCYFLPCESAEQADLLAALLNHDLCIQFISAIIFADAKRPITKKLLQRIDLLALSKYIDPQALSESMKI